VFNVEQPSLKLRHLVTRMHPNTNCYRGIQHEKLIELTIYYDNCFPVFFAVPFPAHPCNSANPSMHQAITHANIKLENINKMQQQQAIFIKYLFLAAVVSPLLGVAAFNKYPPIATEPPIPIVVSVFT